MSNLPLEKWRDELATHRQPWPEWDALEKLVGEGDFEIVHWSCPSYGVDFLASPPDKKGYRISHVVMEEEVKPSLEAAIGAVDAVPGYLPPLLDLSWADGVMVAGGLASHFNGNEEWPVELPKPIGVETLKQAASLIQYLDPSEVQWPSEPTYLFQQNYSGNEFCLTESREIVSFSANERRFVSLGDVDDFVRFQIMCVLEHCDWFRSYRNRYRIDDYNLTYSDDAGID